MLLSSAERAVVYAASIDACAAPGTVGSAPEWTSWREMLSGGMDARKVRLEVRAWVAGASDEGDGLEVAANAAGSMAAAGSGTCGVVFGLGSGCTACLLRTWLASVLVEE